ncbi:MAG: 30S ribosomal protein S12 methylthiotransferase RimO [Bacteroidales bacterium]|nr:30S ribosomal protein S12 methylthiotransferase RimO [Bacteroidales bacterium]MCM1147521.1 30S ribosomal protein S12 methylthiotransferase RimO [Bacteroidales bacterium]MCM1206190.1 30S ribosomal protein S12 methylthiotransferase RimO [Bacillota bacterium]MCM1509976.1 30S ribosomal protein S12 methylthiotransferase RimO [Clostridium sp.]
MIKGRIDIITMGCSKNLVDSESLMRLLGKKGYDVHHDPDSPAGEYVVVNTCGFIGDAKEESVNAILELTEAKAEGQIGKLVVMGCLSERYLADLEESIPEVDKYYGKFDFKDFAESLPDLGSTGSGKDMRLTTTPKHYAYLKISEGCDRRCAYCAIPLITGKHKSRPMEEIMEEVRLLVANGVREFNVIAQELTYYGIDLYGERRIARLVDDIAHVKGVKWIRLHYAYPNRFPTELLDVMRNNANVCKYLDIALQHISDNMLQRMHRHTTKEETMQLITSLREAVPGIHLRTTLMVGFPGETDEDFHELVEFVKWARFECMGAFAYSEEEGTYSAKNYKDDVPEETKQARLDKIMRVQQNISAELQAEMIGRTMEIVVDRKEGDYYVCRSEFSSPEVDPEVLIPVREKTLRKGCFYNVRVTAAEEFDLYATVVK